MSIDREKSEEVDKVAGYITETIDCTTTSYEAAKKVLTEQGQKVFSPMLHSNKLAACAVASALTKEELFDYYAVFNQLGLDWEPYPSETPKTNWWPWLLIGGLGAVILMRRKGK